MYYGPEPLRRKRRSGKKLWLILLLAVIGAGSYFYGRAVYDYFYVLLSPNTLLRLQDRSADYLKYWYQYRSTPESDEEEFLKLQGLLYDRLDETRRVLAVLKRREPARPEVPYYEGLFNLYELLLRLDLSDKALLMLTGRGYLPGTVISNLEPVKVPELAHRTSVSMRKSLALNPDLRTASQAHLAIVLGDLLYTGRTDPNLLTHLDAVNPDAIEPELRPLYLFLSIALNSLLGRPAELKKTFDITFPETALQPGLATQAEILVEAGPSEEETEEPSLVGPKDSNGNIRSVSDHFEESTKKLLTTYTLYQAKNYYMALQTARQVKYDQTASLYERTEAARMEAEIFARQQNDYVALPFFLQALQIAGEDSFIEDRIRQIREKFQ